MAILVLNFVDEYIYCRLTFDFNIQNVNDTWNILSFSDCFLNYIKNLKYFLENYKTIITSPQFSLKLFLNGTGITFYEKSVKLFWPEHEKVINQSLIFTKIVNHNIEPNYKSCEDKSAINCSE